MADPSQKPAVRWLQPDADALRAFDELRGRIAKNLIDAADLCQQLRCYRVPAEDHGPVEIVQTETLLITIRAARNCAAQMLDTTDPAKQAERAAAAIFLIGALFQIFQTIRTGRRADA